VQALLPTPQSFYSKFTNPIARKKSATIGSTQTADGVIYILTSMDIATVEKEAFFSCQKTRSPKSEKS